MTKQQIHSEMKGMLGLIPTFFESIPDSSLEMEWGLFKQLQFEDGAIPNKYRELMGIAVSAVSKCHYCAYFHTVTAKLNGATDAEIEEAVHYAKHTTGWSTYINGLQVDFGKFKDEVNQVAEHIRVMHAEAA
jgi:AhpD family alkylhydroperoxidase